MNTCAHAPTTGALPPLRPCDMEFGPHEHDDIECARILTEMSRPFTDYDDGFRDAYNRDLEEGMLGRPLFPNEY